MRFAVRAGAALGGAPLAAGLAFMGALPALWVLQQGLAARLPLAPAGVGTPLRVLSFNLSAMNRQPMAVRRLIEQEKPDLLGVQELSRPMYHALDELRQTFPYVASNLDEADPTRRRRSGVALFSRYPLDAVGIQRFDESLSESLTAQVQLAGGRLQVVCTHPSSPRTQLRASHRNQHLAALAEWLRVQPGPTLVMGDFNVTQGSLVWRRFLQRSGIRYASLAWATFPAALPLIGIDHILGSPGVCRQAFHTCQAAGSDHRPVVADIVVEAVSLPAPA